jgi:hypothetical protein
VLDKITLKADPTEIAINRRLQQSGQSVVTLASYKDIGKPAGGLSLIAAFEKGAGDIFPNYKTDENGQAKILMNKIGSKELEQTVGVKVDIDAISGSSNSPVYKLIAQTLNVPRAQVMLKVQRPIVYLTSEERSLGQSRNNTQITNRLKNLLANSGFEFTGNKSDADLMFEVSADSERGSISGSIYITYLTGVIKVTAVREGKEIYATTLDRVKGYGLDYDKSSQDAYNKALELLEKERMNEIIDNVLQ